MINFHKDLKEWGGKALALLKIGFYLLLIPFLDGVSLNKGNKESLDTIYIEYSPEFLTLANSHRFWSN